MSPPSVVDAEHRASEYTGTTARPAAVDLESAAIGVPDTFSDCLPLMVGVERGDSASSMAAAKIVRRIASKTDAAHIVINGFSHLATPGERSDIPTVLHVLANLADSLEARGAGVHLMPFGWNERWQADVLDGEGTARRPSADVGRLLGNPPRCWKSVPRDRHYAVRPWPNMWVGAGSATAETRCRLGELGDGPVVAVRSRVRRRGVHCRVGHSDHVERKPHPPPRNGDAAG
ncbi:threonyl-tRNA synthetase editing domain-containing protein [Nocardia vinacea]|uniref:threonyl-tRNA synthetase editing domain-containing protein n=1 Tax=Nocardia vinacea TaxID=96468 RepID=UPI00341E8773